MFSCVRVLVVILGTAVTVDAADWPEWRGPGGQGHSVEVDLPLTWSATENVKWKVPLAHAGNSTPVVWGEKIFVTQANEGGSVRGLLCLDRADGKLLWEKSVEYPEKETAWRPNFYCSASPATDGQRVVVSYGSAGMFCYDFDGNELWKRVDLGKWEHVYGNSSSPVLHGELAILWCGPDAQKNTLLAVDKQTGETVWEQPEPKGSWGTPLIVAVDGQDQLILGMSRKLKGFDPKTGKELWFCEGLSELVYTSPLYGNGIAVAMSGYTGAALAVKLGKSGDITQDRHWLHPKNLQRVGSGAIVGDHVYMLEEPGVPHCYELATGNEVWQAEKRPGGSTWSSMVVSGDRLYILTHNGDTHVLAASPRYELLATNRLGEHTNASIAVSNGELFIRTWKHLWCISAKK